MTRIARTVAALALSLSLPLPGIAQTHVIAQLGNAPLVGEIASTQALQTDLVTQQQMFRAAASKLGLTPSQYAQFASRVAARQVTYVTIPRHLDAMSWSSAGNVYVLHNVVIPAGTRGWEIDLQEASEQIALFVPNRCGNLSVIRRALPRVAKAPTRKKPATKVAAAVVTPPPTPVPSPPVQQAVIIPQATPVPPPPIAAVAASTPVHHFRLWPLLLLPLISFIGHGSGPIVGGPGIVPTPKPGCAGPTPKP